MKNHTYTITGSPDFILKVRDEARKMGVHLTLAEDLKSIKICCGHNTYKTIMKFTEAKILAAIKAMKESEENDES